LGWNQNKKEKCWCSVLKAGGWCFKGLTRRPRKSLESSSKSGGIKDKPNNHNFTQSYNMVSICLCVRHRHSRIAVRAAAARGRARCHDLLYIHCGCVMQFGAKRCAQRARWGCTGHDGRAKPTWATRTGLEGRLTVSEGHGYPLVLVG
jgi:hypothetical protein